jgi:DNA-binding response OmpR family regulator
MSEARGQAGRSLRVLVVDDNVQHVITTRLLLQHAGFEVSIALRGREVFAEVGRFKPDALLLDIGLPELTGYEIARELRIAHPDLLIVAITAYGTQTDKMLASMAGFDHHLTKPYDPNALVALLERHPIKPAHGEARAPSLPEPGSPIKKDENTGS